MAGIISRISRAFRSIIPTSSTNIYGNGGYSATDPRRKILSLESRPGNSTANELLTANLPALRAWCRHLERNNPTARAGVEALVALIVGTGISLEPETGDPRTDALIREQWIEYISYCGVSGCDLYHLQSQGFRDVPVSGELLWRLVVLPERAQAGKIPLAILPLEAEWLDDQFGSVNSVDANGNVSVGPIVYDKYGRPISYKIRSPDLFSKQISEEVPASQIIHEFEKRRAMQGRGEPWLAPVIETLKQERDLVDAELKSAVNTAAMAMVITAEYHDALDDSEEGTEQDPAQSVRLGGVARLHPGEDIKALSHTRPSQQIKPFREMLRGDIAAALRIPSRFLDRDIKRANYSSSRADMLDTERLLAPVREWFGHATAGRIYRAALPYLAVKAGIPLPKKDSYRLLPESQPYIDPEKDARASVMALNAGLTTFERELARRGEDYRKIWQQLAKEQKEAAQIGLKIDLSGTNAPAPDSTLGDPQQLAQEIQNQQGDANA